MYLLSLLRFPCAGEDPEPELNDAEDFGSVFDAVSTADADAETVVDLGDVVIPVCAGELPVRW